MKGGFPVAISITVHPNDQISACIMKDPGLLWNIYTFEGLGVTSDSKCL